VLDEEPKKRIRIRHEGEVASIDEEHTLLGRANRPEVLGGKIGWRQWV